MIQRRFERLVIQLGAPGFTPRGRWFSKLTKEGKTISLVVRLPGARHWHGVLDTSKSVTWS